MECSGTMDLVLPGTWSVEELVGDFFIDVLVPLANYILQVRCVALKVKVI